MRQRGSRGDLKRFCERETSIFTILESYIAFAMNFPRNLNLVFNFARCDTLVFHGIGVGKSPCEELTYPFSVGFELPCHKSKSARCSSLETRA